jgi:fibronectin-binding autotransporter adhesin
LSTRWPCLYSLINLFAPPMKKPLVALLLAAVSSLFLAPLGQAQTTWYWGGGNTNKTGGVDALAPGVGTWSTSISNWGDASTGTPATYQAWNSTTGDTASFGATNTAYNVTVNTGTMAVGGLSTYVFSGTGGGLITLTSGSGAAISLNTGAIVNTAAGTRLQWNPAGSSGGRLISDSFTKTGAGLLTLSTSFNMMTSNVGTVTVDNGTLRLDGNYIRLTNQTVDITGASAFLEANATGAASGLVGSQLLAFTGTTGTVRSSNASVGYLNLISGADSSFGGVITDGTAGGVLGILKTGTGKVTFSNPGNNQTGPVIMFGSTIESTGAGAGSGKILLGASGRGMTRIFSTYQNTGSGSLDEKGTVAAFYNAVIKGPNFTVTNLEQQIQVLSGGRFQVDSAGDIPGTGRVLDGAQAGAILGVGYAADNAFLARVKESFRGTVALGADSSNDLDFNSASGLNSAYARLGAVSGTRSYTGTITPNGNTYRLGGGNSALVVSSTLVDAGGARNLDVGAEANFGQWTFSNNLLDSQADNTRFINLAATSTLGMLSASASRVVLSSSNTFTGTTTVGPYSVLDLSGSNGALASTSGVTIRGGILFLNTTGSANTNANRINDGAGITVNQGGQINFRATAGNIENTGTLSLNSGQTYVVTNRDSGSTTAIFAPSAFTRNVGATLRTNLGAGSAVVLGGTPPVGGGNNNALGGWATAASGGDWATINSGTLGTLSVYGTNTAPSAWASTSNILLTTSGTTTVDAAQTVIYSLKNTGGAGATLDLNATAFRIDGGGVLNPANNVFTIRSGTTTPGNATLTAGNATGGGNYELFFWSNGSGRSITVANTVNISDNGANPVAVIRAGNMAADGNALLTLAGSNSYSGGTFINNSVVAIQDANSLGSGPVSINSFHESGIDNNQIVLSELQLAGPTGTRSLANSINVNADGYLNTNSGSWITTGTISLNNESNLRVGGGTVTLNSPITGSGGLSFWVTATVGGGTGNNYTGDTLMLGGTTLYLTKSSGNAVSGDLYIGGWSQSGGATYDRVVRLEAANQIADTSAVSMVGGGIIGNNRNILRMSGQTDTIAGLASAAGNGVVDNAKASSTGTLTVSPVAGESFSFGGSLQNGTGAGSVLAFIKSGSGMQELTGGNTYSGVTQITQGTLRVNNTAGSATGTGAVSVSAGATLAGAGIITGTVTTGGPTAVFAPGNSAGTLTLSGTLNAFAGATFTLELSGTATTVGGGVNDLLALGSIVGSNNASELIFNFSSLNGGVLVTGSPYTLMTFSSATNLDDGDLWASVIPIGYALDTAFDTDGWRINGSSLEVQFALVPEPGTGAMALGGFGLLVLLQRRRRRVR